MLEVNYQCIKFFVDVREIKLNKALSKMINLK